MKQVVQDIRSGSTTVQDVPVPRVLPGTALVRNASSLVSAGTERSLVEFAGRSLLGKARSRPDLVRQVIDKSLREGLLTTLDAVQNRLDQPMPLGYASAGTIVALGDGMQGFKVGQRVACAGGGFAVHAEFVVIPRNLMAVIPDGVNFESGTFATLGAIALHGFRLGQTSVGEQVAVVGLGLLGLLAALIARAAGCRVFGIDLDPQRVLRAQELGFDAVERQGAIEAARAFSSGVGFDLVQICADTPSNDTVELAGAIARDRGTVVATGVVGTELPRKIYYEKEITFLISRSYGPGRYDPSYEEAGLDYPPAYVRWSEGRNLAAFLDLQARQLLDVHLLITHRFPIQQAEEAYRLIQGETTDPFLAVLLHYPDNEALPAAAGTVMLNAGGRRDEVVRLGVIGAGNFASGVLLPALRRTPGVKLVSLTSGRGMNATTVGRKYGFERATTDMDSVLEADDINTLVILTRHNLHAEQVVAGLKAGKHIFCEKPLALDSDQLASIIEALGSSDRLLTVGFNRRFSPLIVDLKRFFDKTGEPLVMTYRVNAGTLPPTHWLHDEQIGGGRLIGEACHFIDLLTHLVGHLPQRVTVSALPDQGSYREDNFSLTLEFADGSVGQVLYIANGDRALPKERLEVFGGGRAAILDDFRRLEIVAGGRRRVKRAWLRQDKGHRAQWLAFSKAIEAGGPPTIPYDQLVAVTQASFAGLESLRMHRPVDIEHLLIA